MNKNKIMGLAALLLFNFAVNAQLSSSQVDSLVQKTLVTFDVPGIAVAIVKDGKVIHSKGYGVRSLNTKEPVNENTFFGIASNSKAFTAAGLGILVDEGKLKWDDKVVDLIPGFKMYNPYVTQEFTVRDLLTHRSGLGLGAGDLMIFPDSNRVTKNELIHNLRYLKPVSAFRTKFDYDNLLYIVAGEVLAKVSGMSWEEFIETRIMRPLGMNYSAASYPRLKDKANSIDAHAPVDGKLKVISKGFPEISNAAGGIWTNADELSKWVIMQMNGGKYGESLAKKLFSSEVHEEMWSPQTIMPGGGNYRNHFRSYGLGWFLSDENGYLEVEHTGGLSGIVSQVTLIPEMKLGIIVLTNQESGYAFTSITNSIKDSYFGIKKKDRIKSYKELEEQNEAEGKKVTEAVWDAIKLQQKKNSEKPDLSRYEGLFRDSWFGEVQIQQRDGKLWFQSLNSPKLGGEMLFYKGNTFVVKWVQRSMNADAFAIFSLDKDGKATRMKMEAISPLTDFSYDFQDLDFIKKDQNKI
ncbi:serine hydrolase [Pedobacter sp.]|jgi:CubicO group peptidase (beta-lactamase class C family)|uniref:serine hydrolase n=1 Tax=Pedobacter sp. TaxID=1411316 RepID=UPI002CA41EA4|nr:serine hydrolase [Pedobacter sp.]HWW41630.1 serine hydrolase [Pedobacter sp.]